jgi:hypothetical protein
MALPGRGVGGNAIADLHLIESAAARFTWGPVELGDVRFEVDDRCAVDEVHPGEPDGRAGYVEDTDEAEPDGVDPFWPPGGEEALGPPLASQQERNLPERRVAAGLGQPVQPGDQPGVVDSARPSRPSW